LSPVILGDERTDVLSGPSTLEDDCCESQTGGSVIRGATPSSPSTLRAILIPVKSFANAKQRLASRLSLDQRAALARAMMEDVFAAAGQVRGVERVFVVSNERHALAQASARGWESITETAQHSESAS